MNPNPQKIELLLSEPRLSSYRDIFVCSNDKELLGAYQWNKAAANILLTLIQTTEVVLRNTIHNAVSSEFGDNWFRNPRYKSHPNTSIAVQKLKNNFAKANQSANNKSRGAPSTDKIISHTDFYTWELILDLDFHESGDDRFIWPKCLGTAFHTWPTDQNDNPLGSRATLNHIRDQVETLRLLRNRIAHNEPVWKSRQVTKEDEIFPFLQKKIDAAEKIVMWSLKDKQAYLVQFGWFDLARRVCAKETLEHYKKNQSVYF